MSAPASRRGATAARAKMLVRLGLKRVAYDWREQHVKEFEEEILQYKKHGLEYFAFWGAHEEAFRLFAKHRIHPQIWITAPSPQGESQEGRLAAAAKALSPLVKRTRQLGSKLGLYNHGGWGGEPSNLVALCEYPEPIKMPDMSVSFTISTTGTGISRILKNLSS